METGIYLAARPGRDLRPVLDAAAVAAVLAPDLATATAIRAAVQAHGAALVLRGTAREARALGADGAHVPAEAVAGARREAGDLQVGVSCGDSRDAAMAAGEQGADYVGFDAGAEALGWWADMMELPCVAEFPATIEDAVAAARAGADFVLVDALIWDAADPEAAMRALAAALAEARR